MTLDQVKQQGGKIKIIRYSWQINVGADYEDGSEELYFELNAEYQEVPCRTTFLAHVDSFKVKQYTPEALHEFATRCEQAIRKWHAVKANSKAK